MDGTLDLLVIGSGVAGLSAAVRAAQVHGLRVGVLTKGDLDDGSTRWAQGGVAAVLEENPDSTDLHLTDTLAAGGGLCDEDAVRVLVDEGPARVRDLMELGAVFDRDPSGRLELAREGGHSMARIVHAGGSATGAEVERALDVATRSSTVEVFERWFAFDLLVAGGRCRGVRALRPDGVVAEVAARHVLLATGGCGQLFAVTTNPTETTGDGTAMALRGGVAVADVEFMQFHPTALHIAAMPRPLLTEALRGHGALLRGPDGERFVDELQPRDVVSRAEAALMIERGIDHVWLDATGLEDFSTRFPNIAVELAAVGLDPAVDWLPVAPAAHYLSGGVVTDLYGRVERAGPVGGGRSGLHRRARRQSTRVELVARRARLRPPRRRCHRRRGAGAEPDRCDAGRARPCAGLGRRHRGTRTRTSGEAPSRCRRGAGEGRCRRGRRPGSCTRCRRVARPSPAHHDLRRRRPSQRWESAAGRRRDLRGHGRSRSAIHARYLGGREPVRSRARPGGGRDGAAPRAVARTLARDHPETDPALRVRLVQR